MKVAFSTTALGFIMGIICYYLFKKKEVFRIQLIAILGLILFSLLLNVAIFISFVKVIKPLIPCEKYDGYFGWFAGMQGGGLILSVCSIGIIIGSALGFAKSNRFNKVFEIIPIPKTAASPEFGKNSILKCPRCNNNLPLRWLIFSGNRSEYSCANCGSLLVWTRRRVILAATIGGLSAPLVMASEMILDAYWPGIVMCIVFGLLLTIFLPGQYRLKE